MVRGRPKTNPWSILSQRGAIIVGLSGGAGWSSPNGCGQFYQRYQKTLASAEPRADHSGKGLKPFRAQKIENLHARDRTYDEELARNVIRLRQASHCNCQAIS